MKVKSSRKVFKDKCRRKLGNSGVDVQNSCSDEELYMEMDNTAEDVKKISIVSPDGDSDSGSDSDKELQIAFRDGLLKKDGLYLAFQQKRPVINKVPEIREKTKTLAKYLPWIETLDVTTKSTLESHMIDDDFEREMQFYKQAEKAAKLAVPKLLALNVKVIRPSDYYAEMVKSDNHMQKVRKRLITIQEGKQRQEAFRRIREEKKYASKVQKQALLNKNAEKKKLTEAVKLHKKGMKQKLEEMLNNVKKYRLDEYDNEKPHQDKGRGIGVRGSSGPGVGDKRKRNFQREFKNQKYGMGGKKKGLKRNTKHSFENFDTSESFRKQRGFPRGRGWR